MTDGKIHIARNGSVLGAYDRDKIEDMLDTGYLLPSDHAYDEDQSAWILLSALPKGGTEPPPTNQPTDLPPPRREFKTATEKPASDPNKKSSGRGRGGSKSRNKNKAESALPGWIACLFALGAAAGIWAWAEYLNDQLKSSEERVKTLRQTVESLNREKQLLSEITPGGRIRGIITYEPVAKQVAIMSGATVGLYRRDDVERALANLPENGQIGSEETFNAAAEALKAAISSPLQISLTDSNGRIDLAVPEPGDYVLVASAAKSGTAGTERYFWLIGFTANDQPSNLILLNESNGISSRKPRFAITDVRGLSSGTPPANPLP
ncbi:MAG: hypothetical protein ACOYMS_09565 [Terrimicrobiaceae bacterium]